MNPQIRENSRRVLEYMKEHGLVEGFDGNPWEIMTACTKDLGLSAQEMGYVMRYLTQRKLVIPVRPDDVKYVMNAKTGTMAATREDILRLWFYVNPNPPRATPKSNPRKERQKRIAASKSRQQTPKTEETAPDTVTAATTDTATPTAPKPAVRQETASIQPLPQPDIDADPLHYLTLALHALRVKAKDGGEWLSLGVVSCETIVHDAVPSLSKGQARRLVAGLHKASLLRTCEITPGGSAGGCSHVHAQPELVSAALARKAGYYVEETVDELKAALERANARGDTLAATLRQREAELTEVRARAGTARLSGTLADRVQYFVLQALTAPTPSSEDTETQ